MPIIPNLRQSVGLGKAHPAFGPGKKFADTDGAIQPIAPQAFLDTPQLIYSNWNQACGGIDAPLGGLPNATRIAVIGAGMSGVTSAFELAKACGTGQQITLYEARSDIGGRTRSVVTPDGINVAELGAMRFPPSEDLLYYYANSLGYGFVSGFPDPGNQPTVVSYQGAAQTWTSSENYPTGFGTVYTGWNAFLSNGITSGGSTILASAESLQHYLTNPTQNYASTVITEWQKYLDTFGSDSFYTGLQKIFGANHQWDVPGGTVWTDEDFVKFGALGLGSGGFGPLYPIGFNYVFRLIPNGLETNQSTFANLNNGGTPQPTGIQDLTQAIWQKATDLGVTTKLSTKATVVDSVRVGPDQNYVTVRETDQNGTTTDVQYDIVIAATTSRAMNVGMSVSDYNVTGHQANVQYLPDNVNQAINGTHMTSSSKLFIRTAKFWEGQSNDFPRNILSDTKAPQLYTLDYGDPNYGMVLVTYTWEDLSTQLMAVSNAEDATPSPSALLDMLKAELNVIMQQSAFPNYVDNLVPVNGDSDIYMIHWQLDANSYGAFTLAQPGQDQQIADMFYQSYNAIIYESEYAGVFITGDSTSFIGGWIDGALQPTMNMLSAILYKYGVLDPLGAEFAPVLRINPTTYSYS
ncbi:NAD(P)/FAD-dependent oxidoreductase [Aestuariivita sp.]|uniref:flavin monoamine oxidase family protein n=1 Tax=Aestuariivita sp. TaxID=1872407 RepID=UPI00216D529C|nr:NAD(P)/FAD-dependent oxidoreductase [Aestuariivita sp.]MCE8009572.1 FAD-dependent oxidoreductase [Aestuariivita sp.]